MELQALQLPERKFGLFFKRRFGPLFFATFLGVFNDNLLRSGLVIMIAYSAQQGITLFAPPEILVTICSALLMLPFILFSSMSGELADKYEKSKLVMCAKIAEIIIMVLVFYGFALHNIGLLMSLLFVSGTHTTFYGPIKFSLLPEHLNKKELLAANGFIAGGGYIAMLFGLIAGGLLVKSPHNLIGYVAVTLAVLGFISSLFIPRSHSAHPETRIRLNVWAGSKEMVRHAYLDRTCMLAILALSWFMLIGSLYMAQFANYAQSVVHADNGVYILFLVVFSVGTACGSTFCDTLLKGEISPRMTPISALGISVFTWLMVITTPTGGTGPLLDVTAFLATPQHWIVLGSMMLVAFFGGIYIVPLYALLQASTTSENRSRIMAASNLSDAVFVTTSAIISALLLMFGFTILDLFRIIATLNLGVAWYARKVVS